jgi:hypothetical protein
MRKLGLATMALFAGMVAACSSNSSPTGSGGPSSANGGDAAANGNNSTNVSADAGEPVLYATLNGNAASALFLGPTAVSYRTGFTVIQGQAILPPSPPYTLPTLADLTIKFATASQALTCDMSTNPPKVIVQVVFNQDSSSTLSKTEVTTDDCAVNVSSYGAVGQRVVGTFSGTLSLGAKVTEGVFDVPRGPDQ